MKKEKLKKTYRHFLRTIYLFHNKEFKKVTNRDCSIISINCIGGVVCHELHLRFNSPTINLWFRTKDFLTFLTNLDYYLYNCELVQDMKLSNQYMYPVGILGEIRIFFQHYKSFEEAKTKWIERTKRLHMDNLYIVMVQGDDCTENDLVYFEKLDFKHKVCFTAKVYPEYPSTFFIKGSQKNASSVRNLCNHKGRLTGKFWLDEFDWVSFLNNKNELL